MTYREGRRKEDRNSIRVLDSHTMPSKFIAGINAP